MELDSWERGAFFSTVRITVPGNQDRDDSVGTGFLYGVPLVNEEGQDHGIIILISNRHVFEDFDGRLILNFHQKREDGNGPAPGPGVQIEEDFSNAFVAHPDPNVDLAAVGVLGLRLREDLFYFYEGPGSVLDSNDYSLYPGQDIFFVGYPDGKFDFVNNLPIMQFGKIATLPQVDYLGDPVYLIDAPVVEGSSGSAVYTLTHGERKLVGVVAKYYDRELPIEFGGALDMKFSQLLDLGVVVKTSAIHELVDHLIETRLPGCRIEVPDDTLPPPFGT